MEPEIAKALLQRMANLDAAIGSLRPARDGRDGRDGVDGQSGRGEKGLQGERGSRGESGRDGRDGKDADPELITERVAGKLPELLSKAEQELRARVEQAIAEIRVPVDGHHGKDGQQGPRGLKGDRGADGTDGEDGSPGPMPAHEWRGTELRFEEAPGVWGKWVNLRGPQGEAGWGGVVSVPDSSGGGEPFALAELLAMFVDDGNVIVTQTADKLRVDLNWDFVVTNPGAIPNADGALLTRVSAPFTAVMNRLNAAESAIAALQAGGGGGPSYVATKYYALSTTNNGGSLYLGIQEIDFFLEEDDTIPYSNVSNCTATAVDTAANGMGTQLTAYFALDGNLTDEPHSWVSGTNTTRPTFIYFEFAAPVLFKKIKVYRSRLADGGYGTGISRAPVDFKLLHKVNTDDDYSTLKTITGATWGSDPTSDVGQVNTYYVNGGVDPGP